MLYLYLSILFFPIDVVIGEENREEVTPKDLKIKIKILLTPNFTIFNRKNKYYKKLN